MTKNNSPAPFIPKQLMRAFMKASDGYWPATEDEPNTRDKLIDILDTSGGADGYDIPQALRNTKLTRKHLNVATISYYWM